jgi:regulation of enolase protein 1 (concanavalin A-like superfamily)
VFIVMSIAMPTRRAVALILCLTLLPLTPDLTYTAEGGKVVLKQFPDGNSTCEIAFPAGGANSSVLLVIPKEAIITRASVDIAGLVFLENYSMSASSRAEFLACTLSRLDINASPGDLQLQKVSGLDEEFCGTALDPKWTWMNAPLSYDVGINQSGYLHAVSRMNTNINDSKDDGSFLYLTANGSFYIETKIASNPQHDYEAAGLMIRQDVGNYAQLKYQNRSGQVVQFNDKSGGNWLPSVHDHISRNPMFLRLEKDDRTLVCYYSGDGVSWTRAAWGINPITLTDPLKVGLMIVDGGAWTNYPANFDYFHFNQYIFNGSLLSPEMATPRPVSQVRATWEGPLSPANADTFISVRADPSAPWQRLFLNYTTPLNNPGSLAQYKVEMTSKGLRTPVLYNLTINLSSMSYPTDASLALGTGAPVWAGSGEFNTVQTVDLKDALSAYLASATPDGDGNVTVPLKLASTTSGTLALRNMTVEYLVGVPPAAPTPVSPAQGAFVSTLNPTINLSATDDDNDPLQFLVELSDDGFKTQTFYNQTVYPAPWSNRSYISGQEAGLMLVYSLTQGHTYSWRARAFDGAYWSPQSEVRNFTVDITPPTGAPQDEGSYTDVRTTLSAFLNFTDTESGIDGYEYRLGTSQGAGDVLANATSAGPTVTATGLSLTIGAKYYFTARALNRAGSWSGWESSDGILYWPPDMEIAGIRIDQPKNGSIVNGVVAVSGTSWLRDGWGRNNTVQMRADEGLWKIVAVRGSAWSRDWDLDWDSRLVLDGIHLIQMRVVAGYQDGTQLAQSEVALNVSNAPPQPPPVNITVSFAPAETQALTIQENSNQEFAVSVNPPGPTITWMVDGTARPDEVFTNFGFHTNYTSAGVHNISVMVQYANQTYRHSWTLTVTNVNRPPLAAIFLPQPGVEWKVGDAIDFNASTSKDPDPGDSIRFNWELGDGTFLNGSAATHVYKAAGLYKVTLMVSDGALDSRAYVNVTVISPEKTIQSGGADMIPYVVGAFAIVAVAAAAGGFWYSSRHRRLETRTIQGDRREAAMMVKRPAAAISDEDEEAAIQPRETSQAEWSRLASDAGPASRSDHQSSYSSYSVSQSSQQVHELEASHPARSQSAFAPRHSLPPQEEQTIPGDVSFEDIPVVDAVRVQGAGGRVPGRTTPVTRTPSPASRIPSPAVRPPAPVSRPPAPGIRPPPSSRPPTPATRHPSPDTRHPTPGPLHPKNPETLEDILALLNEK